MGFCPVQSSASAPNAWAQSGLGSTTITIPTATKDGDLLIAFIWTNSTPATITTPTGWTLQGSVTAFGGGAEGVYTKVWHTGDASTYSFSTGAGSGNTAWICGLVRSGAAASIVSHNTNTDSVNTTTCHFASFPPTRVGDLRVGFMTCVPPVGGLASFLVPPTVTPSDANPPGVQFQGVIKVVNGGLSGQMFFSLNEDPSGADANTTGWSASGNSLTFRTHSIVLDDGSGTAPGGGDVIKDYEAIVDVAGFTPEQAGIDADSANANWWGGGTNLLGDHD